MNVEKIQEKKGTIKIVRTLMAAASASASASSNLPLMRLQSDLIRPMANTFYAKQKTQRESLDESNSKDFANA